MSLTVKLLIAIYLIFNGIYSLFCVIKDKKTIHWELPSTTYLEKIFLGKYFNRWHNLFWGLISIALGIFLIKLLFY